MSTTASDAGLTTSASDDASCPSGLVVDPVDYRRTFRSWGIAAFLVVSGGLLALEPERRRAEV